MSTDTPPLEKIHRFLDVRERISLVVDLYDAEKYEGSRNYYTPKRSLTAENKIGPPVS
jgi:hypothetical protein